MQAEVRANEMTPFHEQLREIQKNIRTTDCRIFPSSFKGKEAEYAFPRSLSWRWKWLEEVLQTHSDPGVVARLPLFFQLEPLMFHACRASNSFLFINDAANMPVGAAALQEDGISTVVTTSDDAQAFHEFLQSKNVTKEVRWIVVAGGEDAFTPFDFPVLRSIHLLPGLPVIEECISTPGIFHSHDFSIAEKGTTTVCTSVAEEILPLIEHPLPFTLQKSTCSCGKDGYRYA